LHSWSGLEGAGGWGVMVSSSKGMATGRDGSRSGYGLGEPRRASTISMWTGSGTSESRFVPDFESNQESDQTMRHLHPGWSRNPSRIKRAIRLHPSVTRLDSPGGTGVQGVVPEDVRSTRPRGAGTGSSSAFRAQVLRPGQEDHHDAQGQGRRHLRDDGSGAGAGRRRFGVVHGSVPPSPPVSGRTSKHRRHARDRTDPGPGSPSPGNRARPILPAHADAYTGPASGTQGGVGSWEVGFPASRTAGNGSRFRNARRGGELGGGLSSIPHRGKGRVGPDGGGRRRGPSDLATQAGEEARLGREPGWGRSQAGEGARLGKEPGWGRS